MIALLDKLLVLGESSLFEGMTGEELHPVGEIAVSVDLEPGEIAVRQGDPGDAVFVVADGTLAVTKDGRKLKEVGRGSVFGDVALLDGGPRSASVEAVTRARLLRIPRPEFEALIDQHPEIARGIIRTLLAHLRGSG
jgi:CRP-like cAMP-binding protein